MSNRDFKSRMEQLVQQKRSKFVFAKKGSLDYLANPSKTSKLSNTFTASDINAAILSYDYEFLKKTSRFFYVANGTYKNACDEMIGQPLFPYIVYPKFDPSQFDIEKITKEREKFIPYLKNIFNPKYLREMWAGLVIDGSYFGFEIQNGSLSTILKLDPDYCEIRGYASDTMLPIVFFNMKYFDDKYDRDKVIEVLKNWPQEFQKGYRETKGDRDMWYQLPTEFTIAFQNHGRLPLFTGALTNLIDVEDAMDSAVTSLPADNVKMIVQKIPTDEDGDLLMDLDIVQYYQDLIAENVPPEYLVISSPMDIELENFSENKMNSASEKRTMIKDDALANMSVNPAIFGAGKTVGELNLFKQGIQARLNLFFDELNFWADKKINTMLLNKMPFGVKFLGITVGNYQEKLENAQRNVEFGGSKTVLAAIESGVGSDDYAFLLKYEEMLGYDEMFTPPGQVLGEQGGSEGKENKNPDAADETANRGVNDADKV